MGNTEEKHDPVTGELPNAEQSRQEAKLRSERAFSNFIQKVEHGALHEDLSLAIEEIVASLNDHKAAYGGKVGASLTIKLDFALEGKIVEVKGDYATKLPKYKRGKSIFFVTPQNRLSAQDPEQRTFRFGEDVNAPKSA